MAQLRALDTKLTEKNGSSRKAVVVCIAVGILVAVGLFLCGLMIVQPMVDEYLSNKEVAKLYNFYDLKVGENKTETTVYFIGNSQIGSDVYVPLITAELEKQGYTTIKPYNIYRDSDKPVRRLPHIENIIASKPSLVIYGISPWIFTSDGGWVDEDVFIVHNRLHINASAEKLYSKEELEDIKAGGDIMFSKRFLKGALVERIMGSPEKMDPLTYTTEKTWDPWTTDEKRVRYSNTFGVNGTDLDKYVEISENHVNTSRNKMSLTPFTAEKTRSLLAFEYMLERFSEEGIPVALVIMPEHSILNNLTPAVSETNLRTYLNTTNLSWYDLDAQYGDEIMADLTHVHWNGAIQLAPVWADIILKEVNANAIYHA